MAKLNLDGTLSSLFQIGRRGLHLRLLSGVLGVRNQLNNAFAEMQAADPTSDDALVTRRYYNANMAGGGTTVTGSTTVNFGSFPGDTNVSLNITGQTGILAGSVVEAWLAPIATADHSIDEHVVDGPEVFAGNIVAGVGFTIYATTKDQYLKYGQFSVAWRWK